ncbi:hypothetical protein Bbelb_112830 [Branchiostoma belcheri]|nr:hypothetical protein Bbelb_112830 [Branchiostoma belcheri]
MSENDIKMHARNPNPMCKNESMNPYSMDAKDHVNPVYLQSTIGPDVSPGLTGDPKPMYTHNTMNPYPIDTKNDVNPNPMYLQAPVEPPNASPESTIRSDENEDLPCTQASADAHQQGDGANEGDDHSRPFSQNQPTAASNNIIYAHNQQAAATTSIASDDEDIQPYAAAYMCQGDMPCNTASGDTKTELSSQNQPAAASNNINDNLKKPSSNDVPIALHPNPMYVPHASHRLACESGDRMLEKITFPRKPQIIMGLGVAVSADYEIFVTGYLQRKLHVYSMNGTYLRTFPTVLPGEDGTVDVQPSGVAIGVEPGYLWVVGQRNGDAHVGYIYVVRYSRNGEPVKMFEVPVVEPGFHAVIAVDACNNKIIVGHRDTVMMFHTNGFVYRSFNVTERVMIGGITSDSEGNILLTLHNAKTVMVYSHSGDKLFEFGSTVRRGTSKLREFSGICLDTLGRIIVANTKDGRIDMFTSRGKFVRTIARILSPWGIAMGPGGELVLTSSLASPTIVTIFPRQTLLP